MSKSAVDEKMIFMVFETPDGLPMVLFGITEKSFERMKDGHTSEFDFTKIGLGFRMSAFGCKDHADGMRIIEDAAKATGAVIDNRMNKDFTIPSMKAD